jgi:hypothetical protein
LGFCCVGGGLVSLPCLLSLGSVIWSPAPCCQHVVMACWLFNFAVSFDFGYCSLAQGMSFVDHATCCILGSSLSPAYCLPFCLSSLCLLKVHVEIIPCLSSLLYYNYSTPPSLCVSFQFLVYCSVCVCVCVCGVCLPRGLCWFIPGVAGIILSDAWH